MLSWFRNMSLRRLLPLAMLLLALLLFICLLGDIGRIQRGLTAKSYNALTAAGCDGFSKNDISFRGRNGVLSGALAERDQEFALSKLREISGVGRIRGNFTTDSAVACRPAPTQVAAKAPAPAPVLAPAIAEVKAPTCRVLSSEERATLQNELNTITSSLPAERFGIGNLTPTPALESHLEPVASVLASDTYRNAPIDIVGYSESGLAEEYNVCLSHGRAKAIHDYLVVRGIDPNCLNITAAGGNNALAKSTTADGRRDNRRIEFRVRQEVN